MTNYAKPSVRNAWGETASGADLQDPGNTYAEAGWQLGVKPPRQYFNWVLNYTFAAVRYFCQRGIVDWDIAETYHVACIVLGPDGVIYQSLVDNNTGLVPASNPAQWGPAYTPTPPSGDLTHRIANTFWVGTNFLGMGSPFSALSGSILSTQVPVGAVTQWQGSLSIGGGQVTSAVARANALLLSGTGNYAAFQWSGQSGQPTWLFGSNDGANVFVWNPSNFSVANANTVGGLAVTAAASANTAMARDGNGYAYAQYFNQTSANNENPSISQIMVTNGADGFLRKANVAAVTSVLGAFTLTNSPFSSSGYQKLLSGGIIQGGRASVSGTTTVTFPLAFPHGCFGVVITNENSTNQIYLASVPAATAFQVANGNAVIDWIAFGW